MSKSIPITFFNEGIYFIDNKVQKLYIIRCHVSNVVYKNTFVWISVYFHFIQVKLFYIDHVIKKIVCTIFYINFFYSVHLYTNKIITCETASLTTMELIFCVSSNTYFILIRINWYSLWLHIVEVIDHIFNLVTRNC